MAKMAPDASPIACTLAAGDVKDRMAAIADLNREALLSHRRDHLRLELTYEPRAAARVRDLVRRERECCAFLSFEIAEDAERVRLTIECPESVAAAAELLLEPFQAIGGS